MEEKKHTLRNIAIIVCTILGLGWSIYFLNNMYEGRSLFVLKNIVYIIVGIFIIIGGCIVIKECMGEHHFFKKIAKCIVYVCVCVVFFCAIIKFSEDALLDIPYLASPNVIELSQPSFEVESGSDGNVYYYIVGRNREKENIRFEVNKARYKKDNRILQDCKSITVAYLPNTKHVISIEYNQ